MTNIKIPPRFEGIVTMDKERKKTISENMFSKVTAFRASEMQNILKDNSGDNTAIEHATLALASAFAVQSIHLYASLGGNKYAASLFRKLADKFEKKR